MPSIGTTLTNAETVLREAGIIEARREAISLLAFAITKDKSFIYAHPEHDLSADDAVSFDWVVKRRAKREPLQYITGKQEFYGLEFEVTRDVLIPRPETEMVVEHAIPLLNSGRSFCEIGVGSGCIAVSILVNSPKLVGTGLDVSSSAIELARRNAERHSVSGRLRLIESDVFERLPAGERFDLIVSNPPYVPIRDLDGLQPEVRDFEPVVALTDGLDGISIIRRIIDQAPNHLTSGGYLLMEIGFDQAAKVAQVFPGELWHEPRFFPDLQGIPRLVKAQLIR